MSRENVSVFIIILCVVPAHKEAYLGKINVNRLRKSDNDACTPNTDTIEP